MWFNVIHDVIILHYGTFLLFCSMLTAISLSTRDEQPGIALSTSYCFFWNWYCWYDRSCDQCDCSEQSSKPERSFHKILFDLRGISKMDYDNPLPVVGVFNPKNLKVSWDYDPISMVEHRNSCLCRANFPCVMLHNPYIINVHIFIYIYIPYLYNMI